MDKYKIKDYTERLKKETAENAHKMLYMWIKQDVISLSEYQELVKNCSIPLVIDSLPEYDVEEINEIVVKLKTGERSLFEAISDLWNKAYTIGARDEYKTSCR